MAPSINTASARNPGLEALLAYPLVQAIGERRTRRVAQGCSILAGPLSHHSTNAPRPLTPLEEAILRSLDGVAGVVMMTARCRSRPAPPRHWGSMFWNILASSWNTTSGSSIRDLWRNQAAHGHHWHRSG